MRRSDGLLVIPEVKSIKPITGREARRLLANNTIMLASAFVMKRFVDGFYSLEN